MKLGSGRCLTGVDASSQGSSTCGAVDEESTHESVHMLRLGAAQCAADDARDPGPAIEVLALHGLGVLLASLRLLGMERPLGGSPAVGGRCRDAQRCQQLLELQADVGRSPAEYLRQDLPRMRLHGVSEPTRVRFVAHVTPHGVQLCGAPPTAIQCLRAADLPPPPAREAGSAPRVRARAGTQGPFFPRVANLTREQYKGLPCAFLRVQ